MPLETTLETNQWFNLAGVLLVGMALCASLVKRLPTTTSAIYLLVGLLLGPWVLNAISLQPLKLMGLLEHVAEVAILLSLFSAGLKLYLPLENRRWFLPLRLAVVSMTLTVGLLTLVGVYLLQLPLGAAIILGAILAPTDPVLASDVQVQEFGDKDPLRFSLTGEAGLNDGTAFPFVLLGLGLLGQHELGAWGWSWWTVDVLWAVFGGLGCGAVLGLGIASLVVYLRRVHREAVGTDDYLALGLIALSYGVALSLHTYGFLAVFAAGVALRHAERRLANRADLNCKDSAGQEAPPAQEDKQTGEGAPMSHQVLEFNEQVERIAELGLVVLLGVLLAGISYDSRLLWFIPLLFFGIRPFSIYAGLVGAAGLRRARPFISWFGIRGIGSLFYLAYACNHGLPRELQPTLLTFTLATVAASIVLHGHSVTPLMRLYRPGEYKA